MKRRTRNVCVACANNGSTLATIVLVVPLLVVSAASGSMQGMACTGMLFLCFWAVFLAANHYQTARRRKLDYFTCCRDIRRERRRCRQLGLPEPPPVYAYFMLTPKGKRLVESLKKR
ncbi:MAG: hypothetical protein ACYC0Y_25760 [Pirellulales bacterium]